MADIGRIRLLRKSNFAAIARKLDILVDGKKIGNIGNGQEETFEVAPGRHIVQIKLMARSQVVDIDVPPNGSLDLECGIPSHYWTRTLAGLVGVLFIFSTDCKTLVGLAIAVVLLAILAYLAVVTWRDGGTYYLKKIDLIEAR